MDLNAETYIHFEHCKRRSSTWQTSADWDMYLWLYILEASVVYGRSVSYVTDRYIGGYMLKNSMVRET
jgi:hypothetical protein